MNIFNIFKPKDANHVRQKNYNKHEKQIKSYVRKMLYHTNYNIEESDITFTYNSEYNYLQIYLDKFMVGTIPSSTQSEINVEMKKYDINVVFVYKPSETYDVDIMNDILKVSINESYFKVIKNYPTIKIYHSVKIHDEIKNKIKYVKHIHNLYYQEIEFIEGDIQSEIQSEIKPIVYPDETGFTFQKSYDKVKSDLKILLDSDIWGGN
jgi:hypothetical protein